jgi:hypothetical protein
MNGTQCSSAARNHKDRTMADSFDAVLDEFALMMRETTPARETVEPSMSPPASSPISAKAEARAATRNAKPSSLAPRAQKSASLTRAGKAKGQAGTTYNLPSPQPIPASAGASDATIGPEPMTGTHRSQPSGESRDDEAENFPQPTRRAPRRRKSRATGEGEANLSSNPNPSTLPPQERASRRSARGHIREPAKL